MISIDLPNKFFQSIHSFVRPLIEPTRIRIKNEMPIKNIINQPKNRLMNNTIFNYRFVNVS